jgi:hypothetical protein
MKLEYVFMGYIILVVVRFYLYVVQDEVNSRKRRSGCSYVPTAGETFYYHRFIPASYHQRQNPIYRTGAALVPGTAAMPEAPVHNEAGTR